MTYRFVVPLCVKIVLYFLDTLALPGPFWLLCECTASLEPKMCVMQVALVTPICPGNSTEAHEAESLDWGHKADAWAFQDPYPGQPDSEAHGFFHSDTLPGLSLCSWGGRSPLRHVRITPYQHATDAMLTNKCLHKSRIPASQQFLPPCFPQTGSQGPKGGANVIYTDKLGAG